MALKLVRRGGSVSASKQDYSVALEIGYDGEFAPEPGFTVLQVVMVVPRQIGDKMTLSQLIDEGYRRFDSMKRLL